ncbi:SpoIIE family protein phosphatase [Clostridiisalibacter paucivorans]|uniref:SpoIIE family protein phosphatase n=1 Tax=Clostridiisalibacter paucivorans TaxID=408753 RepID=UPI000A5DDD3A|nr:SpoIIE family protein phosphatase [Clostridiisalibacter paucivorans]
MMDFFIDVSSDSLNKYGEELCGDKVEVIRTEDSIIIVLADGLGSGVKANILATLTTKIAGTMLKSGVSIYETVDTIANTLPVCNVRKLAYSTFAIIKIDSNYNASIFEYDNPPLFFIRNGKHIELNKREIIMNDKKVKQSTIRLEEGDCVTLVSDGVIHAGVGGFLNLGWQWGNVCNYMERQSYMEKCSKNISKNLIETCKSLYADKPGDDTTAVTVRVRKAEYIDLFTGPPEDKEDDNFVVRQLMKGNGKKIVCGGTAAKIVSRELDEELVVNLDFIDPDVPPTAKINGIDLVTEGVLTLSKTVEKIKKHINFFHDENTAYMLKGEDGASKLAKILIEDCTHLNLWVGKAVNPAHQNPSLPIDLSIKLKVVKELAQLMEGMGKITNITYI